MLVGPKPRSVQVVHMLFAAVDHMREADFLTATIVLSPTSHDPKRQSEPDAQVTDSRGRARVPVTIAQKRLGEAGRVPIPSDIWDEVVHPESLEAMRGVQIPQPNLSVEVRAMVEALISQNHVHVISDGMPGAGLHPSASTFLVQTSSEKCSFIVNCKSGNRRDPQPQPRMNLPNMWSLLQKFIRWSADPKARHVPRHACTFDIKNCFTSLCLPQQAWGTFRVQSPNGVCDLRTLPFGWKLSPPICQKVVARHLQESFKLMPPPPELPPDFLPNYDHYLDDVLVVMEANKEWLRACMRLLCAGMRSKGYHVSDKSVLDPVSCVGWLGKDVDLEFLSISNTQAVLTGLMATMVLFWDKFLPVKDLLRALGLIGWMATPARGHLPFLGGVYGAVYWNRSGWIKISTRLWASLVSAAVISSPPFEVPKGLVMSWLTLKWLAVDAAEYVTLRGLTRYRVGLYDPVGGEKVFACPQWVNTQQIAELYGVWILVKTAIRRRIPQVVMLQDNLQAIWATVNLKSRTHFWRHNRVLRAIILHLRSSGLILHSVWVPSAYQPADPLSRVPYFPASQVALASGIAATIWSSMVNNIHYLEYKGVSFVTA